MKQYPVRQPLISIVIVFKQENPYLLESITNCFKLDYNNFEIVLLPDTGISHTFQTQINKLNKHIRKQKKRKTIKIKIIPTGNLGSFFLTPSTKTLSLFKICLIEANLKILSIN